MRRSLALATSVAIVLAAAAQTAQAQRIIPEHPPFGHTLFHGSGYINTPFAMVPRTSLFGTFTAVPVDNGTEEFPLLSVAGGVTILRFIEVGGTLYEPDEVAVHGKVQLIQQRGIFPSIAGGILNATTADRGRFGIEDSFYDGVEDAASIYGVMTYTIGPSNDTPLSWITVSVGWGSGLFSEDNPAIGDEGSGGLFGGVGFDFAIGDRAFLRVMGEYDGFDVNVGALAYLAGLEFNVGVLSADEGDRPDFVATDPTASGPGMLYNQSKFYASISMDARVIPRLPWIFTGEGD